MATVIKEWNQKELIAKYSGQLIDGMDRACQFVQGEIEARAPRLSGKLATEIGYKVTVKKLKVIGKVGVKKGDAFYGLHQEKGTSHHKSQPFIRPAIRENGAQIVRLITGGGV